nr:MAG TPA: hypothetical protein [Caudoviricetes sp.]
MLPWSPRTCSRGKTAYKYLYRAATLRNTR